VRFNGISISSLPALRHIGRGGRLTEVAGFTFEVGSRLVEVGEEVQGISGSQKKAAVMSAVKDISKMDTCHALLSWRFSTSG
jgi:hypothetical protein